MNDNWEDYTSGGHKVIRIYDENSVLTDNPIIGIVHKLPQGPCVCCWKEDGSWCGTIRPNKHPFDLVPKRKVIVSDSMLKTFKSDFAESDLIGALSKAIEAYLKENNIPIPKEK